MKSDKKPAMRNTSATSPVAMLEKRCQALRKERQRLRLENAELRKERDEYRKAVIALMAEPVEINKKALLAQVGQLPPLEEFLAELECEVSKR